MHSHKFNIGDSVKVFNIYYDTYSNGVIDYQKLPIRSCPEYGVKIYDSDGKYVAFHKVLEPLISHPSRSH